MKLTPKKSLGQNFLHNPRILERIIEAGEIGKTDTILEIGPGTGNLTKQLTGKAGKVIAIEKDRRAIGDLRQEFSGENIEIIENDVLKFTPKLAQDSYKIIANIPYYITSNFLKTVFEKWPRPKLMVLLVQKEVAQRIVAKPPEMNLLALSVQYYSEPKIISYVSKANFFPQPKIDSAIIKFIPRLTANREVAARMFKVAHLGFEGKRKQLAGNLSKKLSIDKEKLENILSKLKILQTARPEILTVEDWIKLTEEIK